MLNTGTITTIGIADCRILFCFGLRSLLMKQSGIEVKLETNKISKLNQYLEQSSIDILLFNFYMPKKEKILMVENIRTTYPATKVILMLEKEEESDKLFIAGLMKAGASSCLSSSSSTELISEAIKVLASEDFYFSKIVNDALLYDRVNKKPKGPVFSDTEMEIITLFFNDMDTAEIAEVLGISSRTVEKRRVEIKKKVGVKTIGGMVKKLVELGVVDNEILEEVV